MRALRKWKHTLKLADVFHNEEMTFEKIRDVVAERIRMSRFWDDDDIDLTDLVDTLQEAQNTAEFDAVWNDFYDWADNNRVWVVTQ